MNKVIDIYFKNAADYVEDREGSADHISRSEFERELIKALLPSKLEFEPKMALVHAMFTGVQFDSWWNDTKQNLILGEAQIESYHVDETLYNIPLSLSIARNEAHSSTEYHDDNIILADQEVDSDLSSSSAATSTLHDEEDSSLVDQVVDVGPSSPDAATELARNYEEWGRPEPRRRPLKLYGPEIEKIQKKQEKEDGAYHPNRGLKLTKGKGKRGGGPSTYKGKLDIIDRSLAKFDAERQVSAGAEAEAEARDKDGEAELMTDT